VKHILISNDDGIDAPGLQALVAVLRPLARVTVVAPAGNVSAASSAITLARALSVRRLERDVYTVDGTPTDCTHLAFTGLLEEKPDLVIAGINDGMNLGDDTLYSGTVGAAKEGVLFGVDSMAVSLVERGFAGLEAACAVALRVMEILEAHPHDFPVLLNVNVPNRPLENLQGFRWTRLGRRQCASHCLMQGEEGDVRLLHLGAQGEPKDAGEGTDFAAVASGFVSVTPLTVQWTEQTHLGTLAPWFDFGRVQK